MITLKLQFKKKSTNYTHFVTRKGIIKNYEKKKN